MSSSTEEEAEEEIESEGKSGSGSESEWTSSSVEKGQNKSSTKYVEFSLHVQMQWILLRVLIFVPGYV